METNFKNADWWCANISLWRDNFCGKFTLIKKDAETLELLQTGSYYFQSKTIFRINLACKGFCSEYKETKTNPKNSGMYQLGYKRCSECESFMKWNGTHCPCCGTRLRSKPKSALYRRKFIER
jgi:hypothetical protein